MGIDESGVGPADAGDAGADAGAGATVAEEELTTARTGAKGAANAVLAAPGADETHQAPSVIIRPEGFREIVEVPFERASAAFARCDISREGMATMDQILRSPNLKDVMERMRTSPLVHQPEFNITPPATRQELVAALDGHKTSIQTLDTYTYRLEDNGLWSAGKPEQPRWEYDIIDAVTDVPRDTEITAERVKDRNTNYVQVAAMRGKLREAGFDSMEGARSYLSAQIQRLGENKPLDPKFVTVLNATTSVEGALLASGVWGHGRVRLDGGYPADHYDFLRLRASAGVDVPTN